MIDNKTIRQVVINSKLFPCSGTSYHDVTGSICNFETDLAAPLKTCEVTVTPTQAAGTPTPSNPRPIYGHTGLNVVKAGKNLWSYGGVSGTRSKTVDVSILAGTYTFSCLVTTSDTDGSKCLISFIYADETKNNIRIDRTDRQSANITLTQKVTSIIFYAGYNNEQSAGDTFAYSDIQLEIGSTATTYAPYTATTYPVSWTDTVYGGSVDIISGTGISDYGYLVLDGSEDWDLYSPQYGFALSIEGMKNGSAMEGYSNFLPTITSSANFGIRFGGALVNNNIYCCRIIGEIEGVTDVETWKTYLSTNNLIICYPLAVPETLTLEPQTINTLEGINNIWNDAGETTVKYAANGGSCNGIMKFLPIFYPNGKGVKHHVSTF